jgi:YVTN family beta-propeller protein
MPQVPRLVSILAAPAVLALLVAGCQATTRHARQAPLDREGEVYLYLQPLEGEAERLAFTIESVSVSRNDGAPIPLQLGIEAVEGSRAGGQRLLASGRIPPGAYGGFLLKVKRATLDKDGSVADLLVPREATRIDVPFSLQEGRARVVSLSFQFGASISTGMAFSPAFKAVIPSAAFAQLVGYCSNTAADNLTVFDRRSRQVVGVIPTGRAPMGMALDPVLRLAYVALSDDDQVQVLDIQSGEPLRRISLRAGDRPREVGLSPDGRLLVSVNPGSNTASFVDAAASQELSRVPTGDNPVSLLLDRRGQRAFVFNNGSSSITVLDLANRAVAGTVATEAQPVRGALNAAGTRLFVIHAGSTYMTVLSLPDLAPVARVFVGFGASALRSDPRTDFLYLGKRDDDRIQVFSSQISLPVSRLEVPDWVSDMAIDETQGVLFSLMPSSRSLAATDLASGRMISRMDVGDGPYQVVVISR